MKRKLYLKNFATNFVPFLVIITLHNCCYES